MTKFVAEVSLNYIHIQNANGLMIASFFVAMMSMLIQIYHVSAATKMGEIIPLRFIFLNQIQDSNEVKTK